MNVASPSAPNRRRAEAYPGEGLPYLMEGDMAWLASFGEHNLATINDLNAHIEQGSLPLSPYDSASYRDSVVTARVEFFGKIGIDPAVIESLIGLQNGALVPVPVFIDTQRYLHEQGIDGAALIGKRPIIALLAKDNLQAKVEVFRGSGIDPVKVAAVSPQILTMSANTIAAKLYALTSFGLDAKKIVSSQPSVLGMSSDTVHEKLAFLQRSADVLKWEGSVVDFVESFPAIIGFSTRKLRVLRAIAAHCVGEEGRNATTHSITKGARFSLGRHIVSISHMEGHNFPSLGELCRALDRGRSVEVTPEIVDGASRALSKSGRRIVVDLYKGYEAGRRKPAAKKQELV